MLQPPLSGERPPPQYSLNRRLIVPRDGLDNFEERKISYLCQESNYVFAVSEPIKVKAKFALLQAIKPQRGSRITALLFL
jgi:hypothetical protein